VVAQGLEQGGPSGAGVEIMGRHDAVQSHAGGDGLLDQPHAFGDRQAAPAAALAPL